MSEDDEKVDSKDEATSEEVGYYTAYGIFARTLRTWFIAYGIGLPALLFTQERLQERFLNSSLHGQVIAYLLLGVLVQVFTALLYKGAMWYLYMGERHKRTQSSHVYRFSEKVSEAFWLESILDGSTVILFGYATLLLLRVFSY